MLMPLAACGGNWSDDDKPGVLGSGTGGSRSYAVADFTSVDQRGPDDVDVRVGTSFSVRAEGDPDVIEKVKIDRVGDTLRVGRVKSAGFSWGSGNGVKIYITMPRLTGVSLAGSGDMAVDRIEGTAFDGTIAGSGTLTLGAVAVDAMTLSIAGAGSIAARGETGALKVSIAGSGDVEAGGLKASGAEIEIAGAGSIKAAVDGAANVSILGSGDVDLGPKARCRTSKMGSGDVRCGA
jgi:hypothetical protein